MLLLGGCVLLHLVAMVRLEFLAPSLELMRPTAQARAEFIQHMDANPWLALPYVAAWLAALLWLQKRHSPGWSLWVTSAMLALPIFGYTWICLRVINASVPVICF